MTLTNEVNVILLDFKTTKGSEMVSANEDGSYTIFINSRLSNDSQLKAYRHAINHIENGDFEKKDVQQIEYKAHNLPGVQQEKPISSIDFEERMRNRKKQSRRRKKQLLAYHEKMQRMFEEDPERYNRRIEHQYLYGNDL